MRVLFVTRKYPPRMGGMESLSHGLTTGYPEPKSLIALGRSQKHLVWFLPYAFIRGALTAHRYDLIHLGDAVLSPLGLLPRVLFGRAIAISVHGLDLTFPHPLYQAYLKLFLRAHVFIANSESTRSIAEARGLTPVRTITIGVPEHYFAVGRGKRPDPELEQRRAGRTVLLTVGRLVRRKGVAWFVRHVLPQLSGVLYLVVGVGPEHEEILRAASETGTTDKLWLIGKVSAERLLDLMSSSDIFVMPNIEVAGDVEGFGIVAIEAAASGLPVVAARLEGIPDAIADGQNGTLVDAGDAAGFTLALTRLLTDAEARLHAGERGRAYTREQNSWPRIISRYVELFNALPGSEVAP
jgi:glycosyltransferase involved in cell wall biosynthesis